MAIDLDREGGWTSRKHPTGMRIYAYTDTPGAFMDEKGRPVSHALAREAGYDVKRLLIEKEKAERLTDFRSQLDREFNEKAAELDKVAELSGDGIEVRPLKAGGYEVLRDGEAVTRSPLDYEQAKKLVGGLRDGEDETDGAADATEEGRAGAAPRGGKGATQKPAGGELADLM